MGSGSMHVNWKTPEIVRSLRDILEVATGKQVVAHGNDSDTQASVFTNVLYRFSSLLEKWNEEGTIKLGEVGPGGFLYGFTLFVGDEINLLKSRFHSSPDRLAQRYTVFAARHLQDDPVLSKRAGRIGAAIHSGPYRNDSRYMEYLQQLIYYAEHRDLRLANMATSFMRMIEWDGRQLAPYFSTDYLGRALDLFDPEPMFELDGKVFAYDSQQLLFFIAYNGEIELFKKLVSLFNTMSNKRFNVYYELKKHLPKLVDLLNSLYAAAKSRQLSEPVRSRLVDILDIMVDDVRRSHEGGLTLLPVSGGRATPEGPAEMRLELSTVRRVPQYRELDNKVREKLELRSQEALKLLEAKDDGTSTPPTPSATSSAPSTPPSPQTPSGPSASSVSGSPVDWITAISRAAPRYISTAIASAVGYMSSLVEYSYEPITAAADYEITAADDQDDQIYAEWNEDVADVQDVGDYDTAADDFAVSGFASGAAEFYGVPAGI